MLLNTFISKDGKIYQTDTDCLRFFDYWKRYPAETYSEMRFHDVVKVMVSPSPRDLISGGYSRGYFLSDEEKCKYAQLITNGGLSVDPVDTSLTVFFDPNEDYYRALIKIIPVRLAWEYPHKVKGIIKLHRLGLNIRQAYVIGTIHRMYDENEDLWYVDYTSNHNFCDSGAIPLDFSEKLDYLHRHGIPAGSMIISYFCSGNVYNPVVKEEITTEELIELGKRIK